MSAERIIRDGIILFNEKQVTTGRRALDQLESGMLVQILHSALVAEMGSIRDELESAALQTNGDVARELDWATDIIVATLRMNNMMSVKLTDEEIRKYAGGFVLNIDRDEGVTELELTVDTDDN